MINQAADKTIAAKGYAHPDVLVSTQWVADHLNDPSVRLVESNEDILLYDQGHIPGAIRSTGWAISMTSCAATIWIARRSANSCRVMGSATTPPLSFTATKATGGQPTPSGCSNCSDMPTPKIMDGGRKKWIDEKRPLSKDKPSYPRTDYKAPERADYKHRAFRDQVRDHSQTGQPLIDVRSPKEFSGELLHMEAYPQEGALRGGHIPGAKNVPWSQAANEDGTFKSANDLRAIYEQREGLSPEDNVITYCRIGERSSHTWFVLHYLLGYPNVRNYDGSWTEWGNLVGAPIER